MTEREWVVVATFAALWEAELAAGRLDSSGILHRIDQRGAVGILGPGFSGATARGVALQVPSDQLKAAKEALDLDEGSV